MSEPVAYGGQAVIEGVMMRGARFFTVAVRRQSGEIVERVEPVEGVMGRFRWLNKPFLRGTLALIDAMALGIKALMFSANVAMEDATSAEMPGPNGGSSGRVSDMAVSATMVLGVAVGLAVFVGLPSMGAGLLRRQLPSGFWLNVAEGLLRLALFVGYILVISRMKEIHRVFEYHGAEHKTINAYEAGDELLVENVRRHSTLHPRCGTSFIIVVLIVATLVHMVMGWPVWYWRLLSRFAVLPVVAGISYELIRLAGRHRDSRWWRWALAPGLWTQRITTQEPSADQLEVAIRALQGVLRSEGVEVQQGVREAG